MSDKIESRKPPYFFDLTEERVWGEVTKQLFYWQQLQAEILDPEGRDILSDVWRDIEHYQQTGELDLYFQNQLANLLLLGGDFETLTLAQEAAIMSVNTRHFCYEPVTQREFASYLLVVIPLLRPKNPRPQSPSN